MTTTRITSGHKEVLMTVDTDPDVRVTSAAQEILMTVDMDPDVRITSGAVEVLVQLGAVAMPPPAKRRRSLMVNYYAATTSIVIPEPGEPQGPPEPAEPPTEPSEGASVTYDITYTTWNSGYQADILVTNGLGVDVVEGELLLKLTGTVTGWHNSAIDKGQDGQGNYIVGYGDLDEGAATNVRLIVATEGKPTPDIEILNGPQDIQPSPIDPTPVPTVEPFATSFEVSQWSTGYQIDITIANNTKDDLVNGMMLLQHSGQITGFHRGAIDYGVTEAGDSVVGYGDLPARNTTSVRLIVSNTTEVDMVVLNSNYVLPDPIEPPTDPAPEPDPDPIPPQDPVDPDPEPPAPDPDPEPDPVDPVEFPAAPSDSTGDQITSTTQLDSVLTSGRDNFLGRTDGNDGNDYAWNVHYLLRTMYRCHQVSDDDKYMDWAVQLIDHMFNYTDKARADRGELSPVYSAGPKDLTNNPGTAHIGWRVDFGSKGWRVEVLTDGQIIYPIVLIADYIISKGIEPYTSKAVTYLQKCKDIAHAFDNEFSFTKLPSYSGTYHYPNPSSTAYGDDGLYSGVLPFNHQLIMAGAMGILNKRIPTPGFAEKANAIQHGFMTVMSIEPDGCAEWDYILNGKLEDSEHATVDLTGITKLHELGYAMDDTKLWAICETLVDKVFPNGSMQELVDGTGGDADPWDQQSAGYGWLDMYPYDPRILEKVRAVLQQEVPNPTFGKATLAWATLLYWDGKPCASAVGQPYPPPAT